MLRRTITRLLLCFSFLFVTACDSTGGGNDAGPAPAASGVAISDIGNEGNGSDLEIFFRKPIPDSGISSYRIFVVKETSAASFDVQTAESVPSSNYVNVSSVEDSTVPFAANSVDVDGDLISDGVNYLAFILSVADGSEASENTLSTASAATALAQVVYVGTLTEAIQIGSGGMEVDPQGNIYAADFGFTFSGGGTTVRKITPSGEVSTFVSGLNGASGNAFDSQGNLMQSNITANTVSRISPSGVATTFVTGLNSPVGIAIDASDNLYVANCNGNSIQFITSTGTSSVFSSSTLFICPNGIALAPDGNLYVSNFNNGGIIKVAPDGTASTFATIPGNNNGHITYANDVLYVVGRGSNRIYQLTLDGTVSLIAGSGTRGHADGGSTEATFSAPNDLAVSPDGTLLYLNEVVPISGADIGPTLIRVIKLPKNQ